MSVLIVYAHPGPKGHNPAVLQEVENNLESREIDYEVLDLYRMNFNPVMSSKELESGKPGKDVLEIQEKIKESKTILFIYPVWWGSMPAIMKGFIDRVFTAGFAFKYMGSTPMGLLRDKRAVVIMTSGAAVPVSRLAGNFPKRFMHFGVLVFCGLKSKIFQIGRSSKFSEKRMPVIRKTVEKALKDL